MDTVTASCIEAWNTTSTPWNVAVKFQDASRNQGVVGYVDLKALALQLAPYNPCITKDMGLVKLAEAVLGKTLDKSQQVRSFPILLFANEFGPARPGGGCKKLDNCQQVLLSPHSAVCE
jgi:hypothetical protein